jgi:hypothetical protein
MFILMAYRTQRYEIRLGIITEVRSKDDVVNLQSFAVTALLTTPAITGKHLLM